MNRVTRPILCALLLTGVAACTQHASDSPATTGAAPLASASGSANAPPSIPAAPGACGAAIAQLRKVLTQDLEMGHVNRSVYARMTPQIDRAAARCQAGDQSAALAMLASVKKANGYY